MKDDLTQPYLKECFEYSGEDGKLVWKVRPSLYFVQRNETAIKAIDAARREAERQEKAA